MNALFRVLQQQSTIAAKHARMRMLSLLLCVRYYRMHLACVWVVIPLMHQGSETLLRCANILSSLFQPSCIPELSDSHAAATLILVDRKDLSLFPNLPVASALRFHWALLLPPLRSPTELVLNFVLSAPPAAQCVKRCSRQ